MRMEGNRTIVTSDERRLLLAVVNAKHGTQIRWEDVNHHREYGLCDVMDDLGRHFPSETTRSITELFEKSGVY